MKLWRVNDDNFTCIRYGEFCATCLVICLLISELNNDVVVMVRYDSFLDIFPIETTARDL